MSKPWQAFKVEDSKKIYSSFGIEKESVDVIDDIILEAIKKVVLSGITITGSLEELTKQAENSNEAAYMCFKFGEGLEKLYSSPPMMMMKALSKMLKNDSE